MSLGYIGDKFPYANRQVALGQFMSALMMGQISSSALGGVFGEFFGWRRVFFALGAGSLFVAVALWRESRRVPEERRTGRQLNLAFLAVPAGGWILLVGMVGAAPLFASRALIGVGTALLLYALASQYGYLLKRRSAAIVLGTVLLEGMMVFGGLPYLASFLTERFHVTTLAAGLMLGGFGVGGLIYSVSVKKFVARIGELGILVLGGALLGFAFVAIGLLPNWQLFIPLAVLLGMGFYTMHGTLQTRATEIAPEARGTAISLFAFAFFMGQSTGPLMLGRVAESHGYPAAFVVAGVSLFLLAFAARTLFRRLEKPPEKPR
jgi:predicted MFS family arabinose efflux permease